MTTATAKATKTVNTEFAKPKFDRGEWIVIGGCVRNLPDSPGYWARYMDSVHRGSVVYVGPFETENEALTSGIDQAFFTGAEYKS
jgi:hypothetical protein